MAGSQISTSVSIIDNLKGYMALSLTEYNTSAAAAIAAGSVVEIAGAFFTFAGDETPNASSWTAIATGSTAYLALTASGTAGSQIVNAEYTATAPTWRDDLQGWYASAASSVRVIGSVYKAESTSYYPKYVFQYKQMGDPLSLSVVSSIYSRKLIYGNGMSGHNIHSASITTGSTYSVLLPYISVTSETMILSGSMFSSTYFPSYAEKQSTASILIYVNTAGGVTTFPLASGGATAITHISVAW